MNKASPKFTRLFNLIIEWFLFVVVAFASIALFFYNGVKLQHLVFYIAGFTGGIAYMLFGLAMETTFPKLTNFNLGKKKHTLPTKE
jgi:uncharacterized membrane protein YjjP (DUF1212 family)